MYKYKVASTIEISLKTYARILLDRYKSSPFSRLLHQEKVNYSLRINQSQAAKCVILYARDH